MRSISKVAATTLAPLRCLGKIKLELSCQTDGRVKHQWLAVDTELVAMVPYSDMGLGCNPCRSLSWKARWVENAGETPTDEDSHTFSEVDLALSSFDWWNCLRRTN